MPGVNCILVLTISAARLYNIGSHVMFPFLAVYRAFEIPPGASLGLVRHSSRSSFFVAQEPSRCRRYPNLAMVAKTRKRRGKKPGPKPLPRELKRRRITITLNPKYHRQVAAHKSPGMFVEYCISLAREAVGKVPAPQVTRWRPTPRRRPEATCSFGRSRK